MKDYRNGWGETLDLGLGASELSADLEWLLLSGQSDRNLIAEGLLHAYHAQVYRLCLILEDDPGAAHGLLVRTFARAVQQSYRYRLKTDIPTWFFTFLLQELPKATRRARNADLPVLFSVFADLNPQQIANLLNRDAGRMKSRLDKLDEEPGPKLARAGIPPEATNDLPAGASWRQDLQLRYPAPELEDERVGTLVAEVVARVEKRSKVRRRWLLLQELALLLLAAIGVAALIMASDIIEPEDATPTPTASPVVVTRLMQLETTPVVVVIPRDTPRPTRYPTPSPIGPSPRLPELSEASSLVSILERLRINDQFWQIAWADMTTILYGPPGYLGPDRTFRSQVWLSESQSRIQIGPMEGPPDELWIGNKGRLYQVEFGDDSTPYLELVSEGSQKRPTMGSLGLIFDPLQSLGVKNANPLNGQIHILGLDQVAGRAALVVELQHANGGRSDRLWLDLQTSFVLRHQLYHHPGDSHPAIEVIVTRIELDTAFPNQSLFDLNNPYLGEFAYDAQGRRTLSTPVVPGIEVNQGFPNLPHSSPSAGFNPAQSQLAFLYPQDFDLQSPEVKVDVFADIFHLGWATFANPWWMICERSPDGKRIAAASQPLLATSSSHAVYLLDLTNLSARSQRNLPVANVSELAFSPDSRQLAILSQADQNDFLYLADLETNELRMLATVEKAHSLIWNRASDQILVTRESSELPGQVDVVIFDAATGQEVRNAWYDLSSPTSGNAALDDIYSSLVHNPSQKSGLEACSAPPSQPPFP
jgi:hypothetical protein